MLEDRLLLVRLRRGDSRALERIFEKYEQDLISLAGSLLDDANVAEDVVQDVWVSFARAARTLTIRQNLKGYLLTSVANRIRDVYRGNRHRQTVDLDEVGPVPNYEGSPLSMTIKTEQLETLRKSIVKLPYAQREVLILRVQANLSFRRIAALQQVSLSTAQSRYRYGLQRLRVLLNGALES